jgi:hypothetical protein
MQKVFQNEIWVTLNKLIPKKGGIIQVALDYMIIISKYAKVLNSGKICPTVTGISNKILWSPG